MDWKKLRKNTPSAIRKIMFNLEQSIAEWRRQMIAAGIKSPEALDEIESHLREDVERQTQSGASKEEAFKIAALRMGEAAVLNKEFMKARETRFAFLKKLKQILLAAKEAPPCASED